MIQQMFNAGDFSCQQYYGTTPTCIDVTVVAPIQSQTDEGVYGVQKLFRGAKCHMPHRLEPALRKLIIKAS